MLETHPFKIHASNSYDQLLGKTVRALSFTKTSDAPEAAINKNNPAFYELYFCRYNVALEQTECEISLSDLPCHRWLARVATKVNMPPLFS